MNQPKFCWPKVLYYVSLKNPKITKEFGWTSYWSTKYLGKAKMLNKKLPIKCRQIDVRSRFIKLAYVLEGSYDRRYNYRPKFKYQENKASKKT